MLIKQFIQDFRAMPGIIRKLPYLMQSIADPNWFWHLNFLLENAWVPNKYRYMFFPDNDWEVFIDCWMNIWLITDIARKMGMEVYWFEPNPLSIKLFNKKYVRDDKVHIYPCAVSDRNWEISFYSDPQCLFDQWWTIVEECAQTKGVRSLSNSVVVPVKKLTDIIKKDILPKHKHIHLLKLDIEGSEFWVLNDIINDKLYENITYIVVETHERLFNNGDKILKDLKDKIKEKNIMNIYLDWI